MHIVAGRDPRYFCKNRDLMMTREEIAAIDRECEEQHISQQDYLESHEIAKHQYYRWKRKYREEDERSQVPAGFVPMMPWSGSHPVHASPEVQRQTTEASGAGKLPDSGDPHVLQFCDAHPGEHDRGAPAARPTMSRSGPGSRTLSDVFPTKRISRCYPRRTGIQWRQSNSQ